MTFIAYKCVSFTMSNRSSYLLMGCEDVWDVTHPTISESQLVWLLTRYMGTIVDEGWEMKTVAYVIIKGIWNKTNIYAKTSNGRSVGVDSTDGRRCCFMTTCSSSFRSQRRSKGLMGVGIILSDFFPLDPALSLANRSFKLSPAMSTEPGRDKKDSLRPPRLVPQLARLCWRRSGSSWLELDISERKDSRRSRTCRPLLHMLMGTSWLQPRVSSCDSSSSWGTQMMSPIKGSSIFALVVLKEVVFPTVILDSNLRKWRIMPLIPLVLLLLLEGGSLILLLTWSITMVERASSFKRGVMATKEDTRCFCCNVLHILCVYLLFDY